MVKYRLHAMSPVKTIAKFVQVPLQIYPIQTYLEHPPQRNIWRDITFKKDCMSIKRIIFIFYPTPMSITRTTSVSVDYASLNGNTNRLLCSGAIPVGNIFVMPLLSLKQHVCSTKISMILLNWHSQNNFQLGTGKIVKCSQFKFYNPCIY